MISITVCPLACDQGNPGWRRVAMRDATGTRENNSQTADLRSFYRVYCCKWDKTQQQQTETEGGAGGGGSAAGMLVVVSTRRLAASYQHRAIHLSLLRV